MVDCGSFFPSFECKHEAMKKYAKKLKPAKNQITLSNLKTNLKKQKDLWVKLPPYIIFKTKVNKFQILYTEQLFCRFKPLSSKIIL